MWYSNSLNTNRALPAQKKMAGNIGFRKFEGLYYSCGEKNAQISSVATAQLICAFVFAYANFRFSRDGVSRHAFIHLDNV